jgi:ketosteroid isomerase-like protein
MSQQDVDLLLKSTDAFNRRDLQGWTAGYDSAVVFEPQVSEFEGAFSGHEGLARFLAYIEERFDRYEVEFDDVRDAGDRVLALGTARGRGYESGAEITGPLAIVASFRNGKCVRFKDYGDRAEALKAAGLTD